MCGIADEALLARREILLRFQHFRALQMPNLGRQVLHRRGNDAQHGKELGVAVARDDLGGNGFRRQPQLLGDIGLHTRVHRGIGADRA